MPPTGQVTQKPVHLSWMISDTKLDLWPGNQITPQITAFNFICFKISAFSRHFLAFSACCWISWLQAAEMTRTRKINFWSLFYCFFLFFYFISTVLVDWLFSFRLFFCARARLHCLLRARVIDFFLSQFFNRLFHFDHSNSAFLMKVDSIGVALSSGDSTDDDPNKV